MHEFPGKLFGNYSNLFINPKTWQVEIIENPKKLDLLHSLINHKNAIINRDEMLVASLKSLGVTDLVDIGCDFGSLLLQARLKGIRSLGLEINPSAVSLLKNADMTFIELSIQQLCEEPKSSKDLNEFIASSDKLAVSCLNLLHGYWADPSLRESLVDLMLSLSEFAVITATSDQLKGLARKRRIEVIGYLGPRNRALSKTRSNILQYGQSYLLRFWGGRRLENRIYRLALGQFRYPEKMSNYLSLVVLIRNPKE